MIDLLFRLPTGIMLVNAAAAQEAEEFSGAGTIGFVVLAVIVGPVVMLTLAAMFGAPRNFRVPGLFLGALILLIGALIGGFAIGGRLLGFIVPQ